MNTSEKIRMMFWNKSCREPLWYPGAAHGFICAPARSGKLRDFLSYIFASFKGSCLGIDTKGQACAVTARWRHEVLGQKVYRIDPFNLMEKLPGVAWVPPQAQLDPMSVLDPASPTFGADADSITEAPLPYSAHAEPHWVDGGRALLSGVMMGLKLRWPEETLVTAYRVISGREVFVWAAEFCEWLAANGADHFIGERLARYAMPGASENKETLSMVSTASTALQFIGNPCIANSLSGSTFNFEAMKREPITVYLILPGEYLGGACAKWFRLVASSFVTAMMREPSRAVPVLGILDEYHATVGKLGIITAAMGLGAGYGFRLINVFQDLGQVQAVADGKTWETFLANSGFRVFFAPRDNTTAEYLSTMAGEREVRGIAKNFGRGRNGETVANISVMPHARRYLLPYETCELGDDEALVFAEGIPGVIRAGRRPYYVTKEFRFDPDPYEFGKNLTGGQHGVHTAL